jgi:DNA-binding CsgD family transcriptional regulator
MGAVTGGPESGRAAFASGAWVAAYEQLRGQPSLGVDDLERLAVAAHLVGDRHASDDAWERAHRASAVAGDADRAARAAFWLGFDLMLRGEAARANGWMARAERFADDAPHGATPGLLLIPPFLGALHGGDAAAARELAERMRAVGERHGDRDLLALALLCRGEALLAAGELVAGVRCLDEAMIAITTGETSPMTTGVVYCAVIDACMNARDVRRAAEWTDALNDWCGSDPGVVPYRGACLVHRSQVLMLRGTWAEAVTEAERARSLLAELAHPALGEADYQLGEMARLRGRFGDAEQAYRAAGGHGRDPAPGLALLRLAQGRTEAAAASARRMLRDSGTAPDRPAVLGAAAEILLASGDIDAARTVCEELAALVDAGAPELVVAVHATRRAQLRLLDGEPEQAIDDAHEALVRWRALDVPYEEARARLVLADACDALGDADAARLERDVAHDLFRRLGAASDLGRADDDLAARVLTVREREVVALVVGGATNRETATALHISEHTVARHLQNVFTKLDVPSRVALTAWAYEHGLV